MAFLILGLFLFLGVHSARIFADDWRGATIARIGAMPWKGIYSVVSIVGFLVLVWGFRMARAETVVLWSPPAWARHVAALLMMVPFVLLVAAYVPHNSIKARLHHPMVLGVKVWALAHLLANGVAADVLLFAAFLVWAVLSYRAARQRDRIAHTVYPPGNAAWTAMTVAIGLVAWSVFAFFLHGPLIGVRRSVDAMRVHVLRLAAGDDLRAALEATFAELARAEGISAACIVSAVGSLSHAVLRYAAKPDGSEVPGPTELLMLSGTLSADGAHLHASLADDHGMVKGGHLMPGCIVRTTAEVVIALLPGWEFRRELDEATGFRGTGRAPEMTSVAVIDFETTGLSPAMGDRATEIAIVLLEGDRVVDRYQSLMNAGVRISAFIEAYTGISNDMIASAPKASLVMAEANRFVGGRPMVAHNASFDRRFWLAELARLGEAAQQPFACTLLLSRRLYPHAPNHKLGSLAAFHALPPAGRAHRALADAETAAALLGRIRDDLRLRFGVAEPRHALLMKLQACTRKALPRAIQQHLAAA